MKTKAVKMYGALDLRVEEFELPEIKNDEVLMEIVCDSICMSTYKSTQLGNKHKHVNNDIGTNPSIVGHEFAGKIIEIGDKWKEKYKLGESYTIQPATSDKGIKIPGYAQPYCGGNATYVIIPNHIMETDCLLPFKKELGYYVGALSEPMSCNIGAFRQMYHSNLVERKHEFGIKANGKCALFASCGPMGLSAISYLLNADKRPILLVVTDRNEKNIKRAKKIFSKHYTKERGVELVFVNTLKLNNEFEYLMELTENSGFDDIGVYAPNPTLVELADGLLATDGCLNFFAGPTDNQLKAKVNFYNVHYNQTHFIGTSGGNTDDMREFLNLGIDPAFMITHIGGLDSCPDAIYNLPYIQGGKKMIYSHVNIPLIALEELEMIAKSNGKYEKLAELVRVNDGFWSKEAEDELLKEFSE